MNEKLKQTYEILNLPEDITREELDRRFELLLKRQRSNTTEGSTTSYEEEFRAYKFILDTLDQQEINEAEDQRFKKWGGLANVARKSENFFRLYKTHTIVSIIILLVVIFSGKAIYDRIQEKEYLASLPPVDMKIMFLGNYEVKNEKGEMDELNQAIIAQYPAWKRVETSVSYLPMSGNSDGISDVSYMQRAMAMMAAEHPDIIIMDEPAFEWIGLQDGFQDLESVVSAGGLASNDDRFKYQENKENGQRFLTGIDFTDTQFASDLPINSHSLSMIIGVLTDDEKDKAFDFVDYLIGEMDTN